MSSLAEKYNPVIDESVADLISRAANARGLEPTVVRPRVVAALDKYLFCGGQTVEKSDVKTFVEEIRADDLCLIIACEQNDEKAWEDLVANFDSTVKSAARKISSNNED